MLVQTSTSNSGRTATFPVLTDFDLNRPLSDLIGEISAETGWTREKSRSKLNFGVRNTCMGEQNRPNNPDRMLGQLQSRLVSLHATDPSAAGILGLEIAEAGDEVSDLHARVFPSNGQQDGSELIGAELTAIE